MSQVRPVIILGAGGHGREVVDILHHIHRHGGGLKPHGFVDSNPQMRGQVVLDVPVLGDWDALEHLDRAESLLVSAVGNPAVCARLVARGEGLGFQFARVISPLALVSPYAEVGEGVTMFPYSVVNPGARLGSHCILNLGATVSHDTVVGRCCNLNPGCRLAGNVTVGEGSYIGMGSSVIQNVRIGARVIVGAGATVIRDLPDDVTAVGVPARPT